MHDRPLDCLCDRPVGEARVVRCVRPAGLDALAASLGEADRNWIRANRFDAAPGVLLRMPGPDGIGWALLGLGAPPAAGTTQGPFAFGGLATGLAAGPAAGHAAGSGDAPGDVANDWRLDLPEDVEPGEALLGWCLGGYRFDRFRAARPVARLVRSPGTEEAEAIARATWLARDLINLPPNLLGPRELAGAAEAAVVAAGGTAECVTGAALAARYPALAAVGAGSERPAQVVVAQWRGSRATDDSPLLSLVGKGVCFDTGGYDLKPAAGMLRMKKDMGGAAIMLALARIVMARDLPVRLALRLGCVENSVSGHAMRPSDVLATRKGLSVEVGNTDAEGRLVLADLLDEACAESPALLLDAATLTGAARVALGPDLPALFCNDDAVAAALLRAGTASHDPLWRLPLWPGYEDWLSSPVSDLNNVSSRPMAGAITAALFLQRFVAGSVRWAHVDSYGWNDHGRPGRPEGGEPLGLRALYGAVLPILNLVRGPEQSGNVIGTEPSHFR